MTGRHAAGKAGVAHADQQKQDQRPAEQGNDRARGERVTARHRQRLHHAVAQPQQQRAHQRRGRQHGSTAADAGSADEGRGRKPDKADEPHRCRHHGRQANRNQRHQQADKAQIDAERPGRRIPQIQHHQRTDRQRRQRAIKGKLPRQPEGRAPVLLAERAAVPDGQRHQIFAPRQGERRRKPAAQNGNQHACHHHGHRLEPLARAEPEDHCSHKTRPEEGGQLTVAIEEGGKQQRCRDNGQLRPGGNAEGGGIRDGVAQHCLKQGPRQPQRRPGQQGHCRTRQQRMNEDQLIHAHGLRGAEGIGPPGLRQARKGARGKEQAGRSREPQPQQQAGQGRAAEGACRRRGRRRGRGVQRAHAGSPPASRACVSSRAKRRPAVMPP